MMIYLFFTLFVAYTVACCLDGPDLKPLWKKWLGNKLYDKAKKFYPQVGNLLLEPPRIEYYETHYDPIKISCHMNIQEIDLLRQSHYWHNDNCKDIKDICIESAVEKVKEDILRRVNNSNFIDIKVDENPYNRNINIIGELKILQNRL